MNLRFDLKTLQLFVSVVELQSLTRAAEREHIATSAISKRISDLEVALDSTLLHRQARGVEPTAAGMALYTHAQTVISSVERLVGELADYSTGTKGHVRILANRSSMMRGLPVDLRAFVDAAPEIKIDLEEATSPQVLRSVAEGRADLGVFTYGHADHYGLETYGYRRDRLVVLLPHEHPLSNREKLRFSEVLEHDVVNLHSVTEWDIFLKEAAERAGATLRVRYRARSFDVVCGIVGAGLGLAVVPSGVLTAIPDPRLKGVPLEEDWARRKHMICTRESELLTAPARAMLNHLLSQKPSRALSYMDPLEEFDGL